MSLSHRRILLVHNRYLLRGGEDHVYESERQLLRQHNNLVDEYIADNSQIAELGALKTSLRALWSHPTYREVRQLLTKGAYDIVHVHNFFPLISPAIYYAAKKEGVPVVQTLHNFRLLCSNALFFRDGKVCEACLNRIATWPGIRHACYRDSRLQSTAVAITFGTHWLLRTWQKQVNLFIALSQFARSKFLEGGLPPQKIVVKPNFIATDPGFSRQRKNFALFVGRLSVEKGIETLLQAWRDPILPPLYIVGDGPLASMVKQAAADTPRITWFGQQEHATVISLMKQAQFQVMPSLCYENFPMVLVEAFACGTPVLVSRLGSLREIVTHNENGFHFNPGDASDLKTKAIQFMNSPQRDTMGENARVEYEKRYTAELNYQQLNNFYKLASQLAAQYA